MTSSFSTLLAICAGNSSVNGEFPAQMPVTRSFDVFFALRLNIRLSKQWCAWWFEMPSRSLWRHCKAHDFGMNFLVLRPTLYGRIRSMSWLVMTFKDKWVLILSRNDTANWFVTSKQALGRRTNILYVVDIYNTSRTVENSTHLAGLYDAVFWQWPTENKHRNCGNHNSIS